ncbi:hypothetical protein MPNT_40177 [Candidatus Methylacidithermus pantelleriae]|uniref:Uncharacterized protein n=1 Tax=Candidatus Methylacidithermus pantelleriae TaxID=2744239 RepID=A0A8J2BK05_9BACT|nr:hypothetical protein MPNT_40177 [Candidatus Methylacidithermus pantelleriae]
MGLFGEEGLASGADKPLLCARVEGHDRRELLLPSYGIHRREPIGFVVTAAGRMGAPEPIPRLGKRELRLGTGGDPLGPLLLAG